MDIEIVFPYKNLWFDLLTNQQKGQYQMLQVNTLVQEKNHK